MFAVLFFVLRYVFLFLLFLFIFRLVKWMVGDLRDSVERQPADAGPTGTLKERLPSQAARGRIVVIESSSPDPEPGDSYTIGEKIVIGRNNRSDIVVADSFVSAQHARIYLKEEQYWLEDLNSANGTFLNDVRVKQPTVLVNGDKIRVGGTTFQFVRWGYEVGSDY